MKTKKGLKIAIILIVILALIGGAVGSYFIWFKDKGPKAVELQISSTKTIYSLGEEFDKTTVVIKVKLKDETIKDLTAEDVNWTIPNDFKTIAGEKTIKIKYKTLTENLTVEVLKAEEVLAKVEGIYRGAYLSYYSNSQEEANVQPFARTMSITPMSLEEEEPEVVLPTGRTIDSITLITPLSEIKTDYNFGEYLNIDNIIVEIIYQRGGPTLDPIQIPLTHSAVTVSHTLLDQEGEIQISVTVQGFNANLFSVTVIMTFEQQEEYDKINLPLNEYLEKWGQPIGQTDKEEQQRQFNNTYLAITAIALSLIEEKGEQILTHSINLNRNDLLVESASEIALDLLEEADQDILLGTDEPTDLLSIMRLSVETEEDTIQEILSEFLEVEEHQFLIFELNGITEDKIFTSFDLHSISEWATDGVFHIEPFYISTNYIINYTGEEYAITIIGTSTPVIGEGGGGIHFNNSETEETYRLSWSEGIVSYIYNDTIIAFISVNNSSESRRGVKMVTIPNGEGGFITTYTSMTPSDFYLYDAVIELKNNVLNAWNENPNQFEDKITTDFKEESDDKLTLTLKVTVDNKEDNIIVYTKYEQYDAGETVDNNNLGVVNTKNYDFSGWYIGEELISEIWRFSIVITEDTTIECRYENNTIKEPEHDDDCTCGECVSKAHYTYQELQDLIALAESKTESDYTEDSWYFVQKYLNAAKEIGIDSEQILINIVYKDLKKGLNNLEPIE